MSAPTEKHMAAARRVAEECAGGPGIVADAIAPKIAQALTQAEREGIREGMKRAAEIADAIADEKDAMSLHACTDDQVASYREGERSAKQIASLILSEAGEPDQ